MGASRAAWWAGLAIVVAGTAWAGDARAEEIRGYLFGDVNGNGRYDPGSDDFGAPGQLLVLRRITTNRSEFFQAFTHTGPEGFYAFPGVFPGGKYLITAPLMSPTFVFMNLITETGLPEPLPDGIPVGPGLPTRVDLPFVPPPAPAFVEEVADDVVVGLVTYYETAYFTDTGTSIERSISGLAAGSFVQPIFLFDENAIVVMERTRDGTTQTFETRRSDSGGYLFRFDAAPLVAGDHVKLYMKPDQPLLDGWIFQPMPPYEFDYAGGFAPSAEFRFRPAREITGRAFLDSCPEDLDYGTGDAPVGGATVNLWTVDA